MLKMIAVVGGGLALLVGGTVGLEAAGEYSQVLRNRVGVTVEESIPLDVEIDRLEILLGKVQREAGRTHRQVAKAQIALEDAQAHYEGASSEVAACKANLRRLRSLEVQEGQTVKVGCHRVAYTDVKRAMATQVSLYKARTDAAAASGRTITSLRAACDKLTARHADWMAKSQSLKATLAALRARESALAASDQAPRLGDAVQLERAVELAGKIERRLRVAERAQALGQSALELPVLGTGPATLDTVESEVDAILAAETAIAGA